MSSIMSQRDSSDLGSETDSMLHEKPVSTRNHSKWNQSPITLSFLRWAALFVLLIFNLGLQLSFDSRRQEWSPSLGDDPNGLTPKISTEIRKFPIQWEELTNNYTSREQAMEIRQKWTDFLPVGGGDVLVKDWEKYPSLGKPILTKPTDPFIPPKFSVAWVHQLHCLYLLMDKYDSVVRVGPDGGEAFIPEGFHSVHTRHCFDYLRQTVLCHLDMTLEGAQDDNPYGTSGYEHPHVCRSYSETIDWIESHRAKDEKHISDDPIL